MPSLSLNSPQVMKTILLLLALFLFLAPGNMISFTGCASWEVDQRQACLGEEVARVNSEIKGALGPVALQGTTGFRR